MPSVGAGCRALEIRRIVALPPVGLKSAAQMRLAQPKINVRLSMLNGEVGNPKLSVVIVFGEVEPEILTQRIWVGRGIEIRLAVSQLAMTPSAVLLSERA